MVSVFCSKLPIIVSVQIPIDNKKSVCYSIHINSNERYRNY